MQVLQLSNHDAELFSGMLILAPSSGVTYCCPSLVKTGSCGSKSDGVVPSQLPPVRGANQAYLQEHKQ